MSTEDNDNIYVLPEEDPDDSPLNFAAYNHEESNEDEKENENPLLEQKVSSFGLLFKIMFNPVEGWKTFRRSGIKNETFQAGCFYPLLAILALSKFADYFYSVDVSLSGLVTGAVIVFVSFFFGYFGVLMLLSAILPKDQAKVFDEKFGKEYISVAMSTLALFSIFTEILPMLWPILIFLPIWTLYLMFKGVRFFKFPEKVEMKFYVLASIAVIGIPLAIDWLLNAIMPY